MTYCVKSDIYEPTRLQNRLCIQQIKVSQKSTKLGKRPTGLGRNNMRIGQRPTSMGWKFLGLAAD